MKELRYFVQWKGWAEDASAKKSQFALFAFQRTMHLLAAFCGTIFLKLCNQKTRFILRLI